jgi:hypothetical protein
MKLKLQNLTTQSVDNFTKRNSIQITRDRAKSVEVESFALENGVITAKVLGSELYTTKLFLKQGQIVAFSCSCPYDRGDLCKHAVALLNETSNRIKNNSLSINTNTNTVYSLNEKWKTSSPNIQTPNKEHFVFENFDWKEVDSSFIEYFSQTEKSQFTKRNTCDFEQLAVNYGEFYNTTSYYDRNVVKCSLDPNSKSFTLSCTCKTTKKYMCVHQASVLNIISKKPSFGVFFNKEIRHRNMIDAASKYGLEKEADLDEYFDLKVNYYGEINIVAKRKELLPITSNTRENFKSFLNLNTAFSEKQLVQKKGVTNTQKGIVFTSNEYINSIKIYYFEAPLTKDLKIKNPIREISISEDVEELTDIQSLKFMSAVSFFNANLYNKQSLERQLKNLKHIFKNPMGIPFYKHNQKISDKITAQSIEPIETHIDSMAHICFDVKLKNQFYEVLSYLYLNDRKINLSRIKMRHGLVFEFENAYYLIDKEIYFSIYELMKDYNFKFMIHESKFEEFKTEYLTSLEEKIEINYTFIKNATPKQIKEAGYDSEVKKSIYLSESENYILLTPSIRYGKSEVPVLSKRQISEQDPHGNWFVVERNREEENRFVGLLIRQHAHFEEQLYQFEHFYIHKKEFFETGWFIDAFETWKELDIEVFGFKELKNNKYSPKKIKVNIAVSSGIDWFDTSIQVKFGNEDISLRNIQKAIKNKSRFINLGDGSLGLLPEEWIQKFEHYFRAGDLVGESIRTSKINFSLIDDLYKEEIAESEVQLEIQSLKNKIKNFKSIEAVKLPKGLKATLRDYQKEGLNWLNFLDEFNFGGCLADDMGLGKTIQIISFILSQKEKNKKATNLVVVPTSLIFNWTREIEKFAPSLKVFSNYGTSRAKNAKEFEKCDVVLTSYGTLISDIIILKEFEFNYIFLDESQAIKNPESQRYKSVRLLKARNRIVLTGTPIENNTFDLYAQFSFANPGIFGSKQRFKDEFATPIDKFKDTTRAKELQARINPFILRRTKKQVAKELPDKTEIIMYCEMGANQRKVYDAYKNEIREMLLTKNKDESPANKSMLLLQGLTKLRQICNSPAILSDEEDYGHESAKIEVLLEEILSKHKHHKLLIFSQFVSMLDLIRAELDKHEISHEYLTGQTKDREEKVHRFQNDNEIRVFLISLKAGGTGLNLTEADYVYLVDPWWNPAVENQAIDRCYRIGQKKNVVAVRLITPDTIEDKIVALQSTKKELAEDIVQTDQNALKTLSQNELLNLFA